VNRRIHPATSENNRLSTICVAPEPIVIGRSRFVIGSGPLGLVGVGFLCSRNGISNRLEWRRGRGGWKLADFWPMDRGLVPYAGIAAAPPFPLASILVPA